VGGLPPGGAVHRFAESEDESMWSRVLCSTPWRSGFARGLVGGLAPALLLTILACREDPQGPTSTDGTLGAQPALATAATAATVATAALSFRQVNTGDGHSCGVTADSLAYCWGDNSLGALGDGTTNQHLTPTAVQGVLTFRNLTAGHFYTCGVTTDDQAYCWGYNGNGQLGDGTISDTPSRSPVAVTGGVGFRLLSAGIFHTCGISTANRAYCWGDNRYGQLGDSTNVTSRAAPTRVAGGRFYQWLDAGSHHTCATTTDGRAYCWGNGRSGQLGNGKTYLSFWPRQVAGGLLFRNITAGAVHSCGVATDGHAYCWGNNEFGQLGDGTTTQHLTPVVVAGGLSFVRLSGGEAFSCGVTGASKAYCWGGNWVGQLGDGTSTSPRLTPRAVVGPT